MYIDVVFHFIYIVSVLLIGLSKINSLLNNSSKWTARKF